MQKVTRTRTPLPGRAYRASPLGLEAAAEVLFRPLSEMGGTARGAARSGAPHAVAVNETII